MGLRIQVGQRLPEVTLARANGLSLERVDLLPLLQGRRVVLVGLPGAFTPVCTGHHIPELKAHAASLKASGYQEIICIAPNSPWAVKAWADCTDPEGQLTFLSDGNLELARATGLAAHAPRLFLGSCSARYAMIVDRAVIQKLAVEADIDALSCTRPGLFAEI